MKYQSNEIRKILKEHNLSWKIFSRITGVNGRGVAYFVQSIERSDRCFEAFMLEKAIDIIVSKNLVCPGTKSPELEGWIKCVSDILDRPSREKEFKALNEIMNVINNPKKTGCSCYFADDISTVLPSYGKDRYIRHARKQAMDIP